MAATITKSETLVEKSRRLAESVSSTDAVAAATKAIFNDLIDNVTTLKSIRDRKNVDPAVRLNAAKHLLKLAGLEVERKHVDHGGNIVILQNHAESIIDAANNAEGGDE